MSFFNLEVTLVLGFLTSLIASLLIIVSKRFYFVSFKINNNPQKIHRGYIPRLGGIAIILGLIVQNYISYNDLNNFRWTVLVASCPVFIFGLLEDLSERVHPYWRLFGGLLSGLAFVVLTKISITDVEIQFLNILLNNKIISVILTVMAVILTINSLNLIDGLNGLSLISTIIMLSCISGIQFHLTESLDDISIYLGLISIILGVLVFNFPIAKLFLGDGGAYLLGCLVSFHVILISEKYDEVSPFASLLIVWYPIYETLRSFLRRMFIEKTHPMKSDTKHLHSLYFKYEVKINRLTIHKANYIASIKVLLLQLFSSIYCFLNYGNTFVLIVGIFISILVYEIMYHLKKHKIRF